jgi:hypothetical protein
MVMHPFLLLTRRHSRRHRSDLLPEKVFYPTEQTSSIDLSQTLISAARLERWRWVDDLF